MAVRWSIQFKTCEGLTALVNIYDSSYSGPAISLTPALQAFSLTRSHADLHNPHVIESGTLRIIDNGDTSLNIEDIHPQGVFDRPVSLYVNNQLNWRGYISTEAFTMDFGPVPRVISFSLVGSIDVLDSVFITDNFQSLQPIASFLKECLTATQFPWTKVIVSSQMFVLYDGGVEGPFDLPELRLSLSRYNFLDSNDVQNVYDVGWTPMVGTSYLDILTKICQYFNWSIMTEGSVLYLSAPVISLLNASVNKEVSWSLLSSIASDPLDATTVNVAPTAPRPTVALESIGWRGINHRKSIRNGYRKIFVTTNINKNRIVLPQILFNGKQVATQDLRVEGIMGSVRTVLIGKNKFLDPSKEHITLYAYNWVDTAFFTTDWTAPTESNYVAKPRADIVESFTYTKDYYDTANPPDNYKKYLRLCKRQYINYDTYHDLPSDRELATIRSLAGGFFPKGGAICIAANVRNNYVDAFDSPDHKGLSQWGPFLNNLKVSLKIGNKYFNGSEWTTSIAYLNIAVIGVNSGNTGYPSYYEEGKIKDTNEGKYEGAEGFVVPINENLHGQVELTFYPWESNSIAGSTEVFAIFISDLQINYYNNQIENNNERGVRIGALTGSAFNDELNMDLSLSSTPDGYPKDGNAYLFWRNSVIGTLDMFFYQGMMEEGYSQPERWLLEKLIESYTKPSTQLMVEVTYSPTLLMWSLISYQGKSYIITGLEIDYDNDLAKLTLITYE